MHPALQTETRPTVIILITSCTTRITEKTEAINRTQHPSLKSEVGVVFQLMEHN